MFASKTTAPVTILDEGVEVIVTIRKLSWKTLEKAEEIKTERDLARTQKMGPVAAQAIGEGVAARVAARAATAPDLSPEDKMKQLREARYRNYDRDTIVRAGVKSWTADQKLPGALEDLDEVAGDQLYREIVDLSLPPLDPAVEEAARKNA